MKTRLMIFLTILMFFGYPSCHCPEFALITGVERCVFHDPLTHERFGGGETSADTLEMLIQIDFEAYGEAGIPGTMSEADAFQFDCFTPLANTIRSFIVMSTSDFNDISAGQSLNSKLWNLTLNAPLDLMPTFEVESYEEFDLSLRFLEKPVQSSHTFTIEMIDNAGNKFLFQTEPLIWL